MNISGEFKKYIRVLWSWAWLILLGGIIAGGINFYLASKTPPVYQANVTLMVGQFIKQAVPDSNEVGLTDRLALYYLDLLRRKPVLEGVKAELGLKLTDEELAAKLAARVVPATSFIEISVVDSDPTRAVNIINAVSRELIKQTPTSAEGAGTEATNQEFVQKQLTELQDKLTTGRKSLAQLNDQLGKSTTAAEINDVRSRIKALETQIDGWQSNYISLLRLSNSNSPNSISILEESNQAKTVKGISPLISAGIAAAIGMALALIVALVLEYLDDRVKTTSEIEYRLRVPVLGKLPAGASDIYQVDIGAAADSGAPPLLDKRTVQSYEILLTNVIFNDMLQGERRSIMITGPEKLAEQSSIAMNLGITSVSFERSVLLVDADTAKPELHDLLDTQAKPGFYEIFYGTDIKSLEDKIHPTAVPNLYLMPSGQTVTESKSLVVLRSGAQQIYDLAGLELPGDLVIFNCNSILTDKIARLLTSHITGTILVARLHHTRTQELREAIEVVERLKGTVLGVVTVDKEKGTISDIVPFVGKKKKGGAKKPKAAQHEAMTSASGNSQSDNQSDTSQPDNVNVPGKPIGIIPALATPAPVEEVVAIPVAYVAQEPAQTEPVQVVTPVEAMPAVPVAETPLPVAIIAEPAEPALEEEHEEQSEIARLLAETAVIESIEKPAKAVAAPPVPPTPVMSVTESQPEPLVTLAVASPATPAVTPPATPAVTPVATPVAIPVQAVANPPEPISTPAIPVPPVEPPVVTTFVPEYKAVEETPAVSVNKVEVVYEPVEAAEIASNRVEAVYEPVEAAATNPANVNVVEAIYEPAVASEPPRPTETIGYREEVIEAAVPADDNDTPARASRARKVDPAMVEIISLDEESVEPPAEEAVNGRGRTGTGNLRERTGTGGLRERTGTGGLRERTPQTERLDPKRNSRAQTETFGKNRGGRQGQTTHLDPNQVPNRGKNSRPEE